MAASDFINPRTRDRAIAQLVRDMEMLKREKSPFTRSSDIAVGALAYNSTNQSIPNNALTPLALDSERFDTDGIHDNVTNNTRLTCQTSGKYAVFADVIWTANTTGIRVLEVVLNGTTGIILQSTNALSNTIETTRQNLAGLIDLVTGDYLEAWSKQTSGGALNSISVISPGGIAPNLGMVRLL